MDQFKTHHQTILNFLQKEVSVAYELRDQHYKLPLSDALFCAQDLPRNKAFYQALHQVIQDQKEKKEKITILDAGSGTGILGAFALLLGADRCIFLEHNPYSLGLSKILLKDLDLESKCEFIQCDATNIGLNTKYNILISETLSSGFINEDFPQIINHLKQFKEKDSVIIPQSLEVEITEDTKNKQIQSFTSQKGFQKKEIKISNKTKKLSFKTKAQLYNDIYLESGDCVSFLNPTEIFIKTPHPLFSLQVHD